MAFSAVKRGNSGAGRLIRIALAALPFPAAASAEDVGLRLSLLPTREAGQHIVMDLNGPLGLLMLGLAIITSVTALMHIVERRRWEKRAEAQAAEVGALQARLQQAEVFMSGDRQVVLSWARAAGEPEIEGDVNAIAGSIQPQRILNFAAWMARSDARRLDEHLERLKASGVAFSMSCDTSGDKRVEIDGRPVAGRAVVRIRDVTGDRLERLKADEKFGKLAGEMAALQAILDAIPQPMWLRYDDGRLAWVNRAYAEAVDCKHPNEAIGRGVELLDRGQRERIAASNADAPFKGSLPVIMSGRRTMLDVVDVRTPFGSGGLGADASEAEQLRARLDAETKAYLGIIDDLPTAVAFFDRKRSLKLTNAAYRKLWGLAPEFLAGGPSDSEILDRLRADRKLPEQVDFRGWKENVLKAYQSHEPTEHLWHLPDRRMLRVVATPTADGGLSYIYHDMTERMTLEAQFKALSQVQDETLNNLKEGVAVFGSDGRLRLSNAAFVAMWRLPPEILQGAPHISDVIRNAPGGDESTSWEAIREHVIGFAERRISFNCRETRADGKVVETIAAPLPNGDMLLTFVDVTDEVNAERFLKEKNEALVAAASMKTDIINNLSFELREPLQGVTMSAGLLTDEMVVGPLTPKQRQYAEDARRSAEAMLVMMNEIFDLASLDAGTLELELEQVAAGAEIAAVATGLADRLANAHVALVQDVRPGADTFQGDRHRVRQIMFHLIANAIRVSPAGSEIVVSARIASPFMEISVKDRGPGVPQELVPRMFERFGRIADRGAHRGVGLGLPLVKALVELHGGEVALQSAPGAGTTVTCRFPIGGGVDEPAGRKAA